MLEEAAPGSSGRTRKPYGYIEGFNGAILENQGWKASSQCRAVFRYWRPWCSWLWAAKTDELLSASNPKGLGVDMAADPRRQRYQSIELFIHFKSSMGCLMMFDEFSQ